MQRALRRGRSRVVLERVKSVIVDHYDGKDMRDPAREKLIQTRKDIVGQWMTAADILDKQGETTLARDKVPVGSNGQRPQRDDLTR
jgi:hypothetical protein